MSRKSEAHHRIQIARAIVELVVCLAVGLASAVAITLGEATEAVAAVAGAVFWGVRALRR